MGTYPNSNAHLDIPIYENQMITFALDRALHGLLNDILDLYERFILSVGLQFGKMWIFLEKWPFFWADMAGLGKYHMGGYGRIGVYRVKLKQSVSL